MDYIYKDKKRVFSGSRWDPRDLSFIYNNNNNNNNKYFICTPLFHRKITTVVGCLCSKRHEARYDLKKRIVHVSKERRCKVGSLVNCV